MAAEAFPGAKSDPRIARTRKHVIDTTRQMLDEATEPLSFTAVADRAFVARQTLYKHWGSIENLIADTVSIHAGEVSAYDGLDLEARTSKFLTDLASNLTGGTSAGFATIQAAAHYSSEAQAALQKLNDEIRASFSLHVGKIDDDGYAQLVSPVVYVAIAGGRPSKKLVDSLSARASELVG